MDSQVMNHDLGFALVLHLAWRKKGWRGRFQLLRVINLVWFCKYFAPEDTSVLAFTYINHINSPLQYLRVSSAFPCWIPKYCWIHIFKFAFQIHCRVSWKRKELYRNMNKTCLFWWSVTIILGNMRLMLCYAHEGILIKTLCQRAGHNKD